ncbi:ABC transporter ATP-binding protein [Ramlibacter sp.]|uniref:ABC transporter ATP-binding protein n=1 Tax=Ramlibacter sp. TaxID=1917967 RepID=UPI003D10A81A
MSATTLASVPASSRAPVLSIEKLSVSYGHVRAVTDVDLQVAAGEVVALLGPNGAGKTTTLRAVSGVLPRQGGSVSLCGEDLSGRRPDQIVRAGLIHVPEGRQVVAPLTVRENLQLAGLASRRCPPKELDEGIERVFTLFPNLSRRRDIASGLLSGGEQQMLAMGRALIARPVALLLDEPSMGLSPLLTEVIYEFLARRAEVFAGVAIVLAEQSRIALSVADRVCILSKGRVAFTGLAHEASRDVTVRAYLGHGAAGAVSP